MPDQQDQTPDAEQEPNAKKKWETPKLIRLDVDESGSKATYQPVEFLAYGPS